MASKYDEVEDYMDQIWRMMSLEYILRARAYHGLDFPRTLVLPTREIIMNMENNLIERDDLFDEVQRIYQEVLNLQNRLDSQQPTKVAIEQVESKGVNGTK